MNYFIIFSFLDYKNFFISEISEKYSPLIFTYIYYDIYYDMFIKKLFLKL